MKRSAQTLQQNKLETWGGGRASRAPCPPLLFAFLLRQCFPTSLRRARKISVGAPIAGAEPDRHSSG